MVKVKDFLGPYRLARLIRLGSTCQVWEAIHEQENRRVALKVLRPEQRGNKDEIAFIKHEYDVAKDLNHRNVIKLSEYVTSAPTPFIVMELFSELNLKMAIRKGPDPIAYQLQSITEQACESLSYLHAKGYVHCDVKPDNFLLSRDWEVKLIDFTIAKKIKSGLGRIFAGRTKVEGTRSYMSPEQIRGQPLDPRSDVYSFGCTLFEMVAGRPPYTATSANELLNKHLSASIPSVLAGNDNISPNFNGLLRKMMSKKPEERFQTMWDVLKNLHVNPIFKKPPRIPATSVFDDHQGGGRIDAPT